MSKRAGRFIVGALAAAGWMGCGGTSLESQTDSVAQALSTVSNTADAPEAAGMMRGAGKGFKLEAAEGLRCDSSPDITYADVCGQSLPATVHLEWTDCAPPSRPGHGDADGSCPHGGPGGPGDGPPPPALADGSQPPPRERGRHGGPGMRGHGGGRGGEGHGPSSGTADITYTYATPDGCTGAILQAQAATFDVSRTAPDGTVSRSVGSSTSEAELVTDGRPLVKSMQVDVTRTVTDGAGTELRNVHVVGTRSVSFSSDEPPVRTVNGSYTETFSDGTTSTAAEVDVVQPPRTVCPWPLSGTMTRTAQDGTHHVLTYGPTCGAASLDGEVVDLTIRRGGPERGMGGGADGGGHH